MAASKSKDAVRHCFPFEPYMHHEWQYEGGSVSCHSTTKSLFASFGTYDIVHNE